MIEIRPLKPDEISQAQKFLPGDAAKPDWNIMWAVLDEKEIVGVFGIENRIVVEPLYMKNGNYAQAYGAMTWIDGFLRAHAAAQGKLGYEFFVGDNNPKFQEFIEKHLPVRKGREKPGLFFFRKFEV